MKKFLWRTVLRGLALVLPVILIVIALEKLDSSVRSAMQPFAAALPFGTSIPILWALLALVLLSFLAGLILQLPVIRDWYSAAMDWLAERSPTFASLRGFEKSLLAKNGNKPLKAALAVLDDALVPAIVVEELPDGRSVVFIPNVPSPSEGTVYILTSERVHLLDATVHQVTACVRSWGLGARQLVQAMRSPHKPAHRGAPPLPK